MMKYAAPAARVILVLLGIFCIITVIFAITARDAWWIRAFDYPRIQIAVISIVVLILGLLFLDWKKRWIQILLVLLTVAILYQGYVLHPYFLPVAPEVPARTQTAPERTFSLFVSNILMENRDVGVYLDVVAEYDPDIVLVIEPNEWWTAQLAPLRERYPHHVEHPQGNHYGMNLYARFPLSATEIHYFEHDETPAIEAILQLPSGDEVLFYGVHPRPPLPGTSVEAADRELLILAERTQAADLPTVVAGDFNDVPWSYTLEQFQEISQLRDLRVGRGFYNTFDAQSYFLRTPIDHIFISPGLGLVQLAEPIAIASDHYAFLAGLVVDETVQ